MNTLWSHVATDSSPSFWRSGTALVAAVHIWFYATVWPLPAIPCAAAATSQVHGAPLDEALDFYQYSDDEGGIHFVDSPEKIPGHYRKRVIVRKDIPSARQTTKVVIVDGIIHLPVLFRNGNRAEQAIMILDTGSATTSITEEFAARLGIDPTAMRKSTTRLADGRRIAVQLAKLEAVSVGRRTKSPIEVAILPQVGIREPHDGLLGLDFLSGFQYQIDLPSGLIRWQ